MFPNTLPCCEGCPDWYAVGQLCEARCRASVCELAKIQHDEMKESECNPVEGECIFDMDACLVDTITVQQFAPGDCVAVPSACYVLTTLCALSPDIPTQTEGGCFDFDCNGGTQEPPTEECKQEFRELDPAIGTSQHTAGPSTGTSVELSWVYQGQPDLEQTVELDGDLSYRIDPCSSGGGDCFALTQLAVQIPDGQYSGVQLTDATLHVSQVLDFPPIGRSAAAFPAYQIQAVLVATANGSRIGLVGWNTQVANAIASPAANTLSFTNLVFDYTDTVLQAQLRIDIQGVYTSRAPIPALGVLDAPTDCSAPVVFEARSVDLDGDPMTHAWSVASLTRLGPSTGHTLSIVMPPGTHRVAVTSTDSRGRVASAGMDYVRSCQ